MSVVLATTCLPLSGNAHKAAAHLAVGCEKSLVWGMDQRMEPVMVNTSERGLTTSPPPKEVTMTTTITTAIDRHRGVLLCTLGSLAALALTAGALIATPKHGATVGPHQPTLDCTIPTPGLEAPCRQTVEVNPQVV